MAIGNWLEALARLRIAVFREYPYLYEGSLDYETRYLQTYINCQEALAVLLFDGAQVVGASTGLPMMAETPEFRQPVIAGGYDASTFFYCGESTLLPQYRGQGLYKRFFESREQHAKALVNMTQIGFCAVIRPSDHPLKPQNYQPLDGVWIKQGYQQKPDMTAQFNWQDIDQPAETLHPLTFWVKPL